MSDIETAIEKWFQSHFGNFTPGTEIYALLQASKRDLKSVLGVPASEHVPSETDSPPQEK